MGVYITALCTSFRIRLKRSLPQIASSENLSYPAMMQANQDIFKIGRIAVTTKTSFGIPANAFSCIVSKEPYKPTQQQWVASGRNTVLSTCAQSRHRPRWARGRRRRRGSRLKRSLPQIASSENLFPWPAQCTQSGCFYLSLYFRLYHSRAYLNAELCSVTLGHVR